MKRLTALAALLIAIAPAVASAQSTPPFVPQSEAGGLANPLAAPAFACPTFTSWTFCNSIQQYVSVYNQWVKLHNDMVEIQRNVNRYATYPTKLRGYVQADLNTVQAAVDQVDGLAATDKSVESTVARLFPSYAPGMQYADLTDHLGKATIASILNAVKVAGAETSSQGRDADVTQAVRDAASSATSPTQAVQMLAQLTAVLIEQSQKHQRLTASSMMASSAYYLSETQAKQASDAVQRSAVASFRNQWSGTLPPPLSPEQAKAILNIP